MMPGRHLGGKGELAHWFFRSVLPSAGITFAVLYAAAFFNAVAVVVRKHGSIPLPIGKQILYCFTFPIFMAVFLPLSFVALFKKVGWKKVPHTADVTIGEIAAAADGKGDRPVRRGKKRSRRIKII